MATFTTNSLALLEVKTFEGSSTVDLVIYTVPANRIAKVTIRRVFSSVGSILLRNAADTVISRYTVNLGAEGTGIEFSTAGKIAYNDVNADQDFYIPLSLKEMPLVEGEDVFLDTSGGTNMDYSIYVEEFARP